MLRAEPFMAPGPLARCRRLLGALRRDEEGISVVEFALALPFLVSLGMYGVEVGYMTSVNMQVSQLALAVADNASRLGQTDNSSTAPTITETDVDAVMFGALQQGAAFNFEANGRIILSSLERDDASDKQYIHWQRCAGLLDRQSSYGNDSDRNGLTGPELDDMGETGQEVTAPADQAVMFVEVYYTYQPLFGEMFVGNRTFKHEAAFIVRDDRDLEDGLEDNSESTISTRPCDEA